jgi:sugar fermentation stimulation protein A
MQFDPPLLAGTLIRRYKRFLADVKLQDGSQVTVHCPNTGAMLGCDQPGSAVWLAQYDNPKRKYPLGWELVETLPGVLVGLNTGKTNQLVHEAIGAGVIAELVGYTQIKTEVRVDHGRLDFCLQAAGRRDCMVEVKSVTASTSPGLAIFPDAVSARASRHMQALSEWRQHGGRAVLVFCVQREDVRQMRPAREIDPNYAEAIHQAMATGVEILAYRCRVSTRCIELVERVEFLP